jgi:outer membrane protein assembly factor BamA
VRGLLLVVLCAACAAAQTRVAEIERAREEKAARLAPETVSRTEEFLRVVKEQKWPEKLLAGFNGLRIGVGNMATGSGMAFGPDFLREDLLDGNLSVNASVMTSTRLWQKHQAGFNLPRLAGGKINAGMQAIARNYGSLEYYGNGPESARTGRTVYRLEDTAVQGGAGVHLGPWLRLGGSAAYLLANVGPGKREGIASAHLVYSGDQAPGIWEQTNFVRYGAFAQLDLRDDPLGPKAGGNYVAQYTWYSDRQLSQYEFRRFDVDVQQYVPFYNKTRRLALRARLTLTDTSAGMRVPFYLQPVVGGSDDLRGFRPFRFSGRNAVVYNAEYRWEVFAGLDGALFFDAGKVMPHRGYLKFRDLEASAGFGLRFNARNRTFFRIDVGFSHEGYAVWFKFNDSFLPRLFGVGIEQPVY